MQLKHLKTVIPAEEGVNRISAICWAPNNLKLAVCTSDRVVHLYDETGEKKDKFSTKPVDPKYGKKSYAVKGLAFSPDSTKIAVGQTDNIIFVYKIGEEWGEKKVICNKFPLQSSVTCLIWLSEGHIVFGQADGKVRVGYPRTNKSSTLYATDSLVVALTANSSGTAFLSGHADGAIVRFYMVEDGNTEKQGRVVTHSSSPYALAWPRGHIVAAGCDQRVVVYNKDGKISHQFDYSRDDTEKEFTVACCSPSGQAVAVGSYDRIRIFSWSPRKSMWEENPPLEIRYLYTITALAWKRDGSRVACGTLCGGVELVESVLKRSVWKGKFEMTYVGPSQVLVKPLTPGSRGVVLKSQYGYEIEEVRVMGKDNYLVGRTSETLLLGDLQRNLLSEVVWPNSGRNEKFYFDNPEVCLVFNAGELALIEYGNNEILGSVRTEFMNPHQISVRLNERRRMATEENKKLAYLLDLKTISVIDLVYGTTVTQVPHDSKIDWLELNETSRKLLFRDKKMRLIVVDLVQGHKVPICTYCTFVQWVPGSDVVVAQARNNLCVWYNIDSPEQVVIFPIKGDVIDVVRAEGRTEVVVQEGQHQLGYELDEGLVEFDTAIHDNDLGRAVVFLESLGEKSEARGMWSNLANIAVATDKPRIAERCYAALGDVARSHYLRETIRIAEEYAKENDDSEQNCPELWARMAILGKRLKEAETIYLEQNQLDKALEMYRGLHKWEEALALAEMKSHPSAKQLKADYMKWLIETKQGERAGELKEREGDKDTALNLYLSAGLPTRAARLVQNNYEMLNNEEIVDKVISALLRAGLLEQAGELYEKTNQSERAFDCYRKAQAFSRAIEVARYVSPSEVVKLEEQWGDYLVANKQLDAAVNHYIEAGKTVKALEAAVGSHQWKKAVQIIQAIEDPSSMSKYYIQLGKHFTATQEYEIAEKLYVSAGMVQEAVDMYNAAGEWDKAHQLATKYLEVEDVSSMFLGEARRLEEEGKLREAEKLYISVSEPDLAISMYKSHKQYEQMMRLVSQYHPDLVQTTHLHLAQELENSGNLTAAEQHFMAAGQWKGAANMYRSADMWEDAYRVAVEGGGSQAGQQVAFLWAKSLSTESAVKLLTRLNLLESSIDYACEVYQFEFAFALARNSLESKMSEIHYKYAMALEDDGKFREAEEEFIKADKPREAVLMYMHNKDWENAQRVAEQYSPDSAVEVYLAQGKECFEAKNFSLFESYLLKAQKPELIVEKYRDEGMWEDALRMCREHVPSKYSTLQAQYDQLAGTSRSSLTSSSSSNYFARAKQLERNREYVAAIDYYSKVNFKNTPDEAVVMQAWGQAVSLTSKYLQGVQAIRVAKILGPQLLSVKEYTLAAQVYIAADMIQEAIDSFIVGNDWTNAKKVAKELDPSYESYVDDKYKESLKREGRADQLADVDIMAALDLLADQGQWGKCLETAAQHGEQVLHKYIARYAAQLIKDGYPLEALALYTKHGAPVFPQNYNIYKRIAVDLFSLRDMVGPESYNTWTQLRNMLRFLTERMKHGADTEPGILSEFEELLLICHYYASRAAYRSVPSLEQLVMKLSISLLRHSDVVPADKAFYEAGTDCRAVGRDNEAFVYLNHYLDLSDAIEEGNYDIVDYTDFISTDIPTEVPLPATPHLTPVQHEDVKEWVLAVSVDQKIEQALPLDDRGVHESNLAGSLPCVVTGYPVLVRRNQSPVEFRQPGKVANREDWNKVIMANTISQNSSITDVLSFIDEWCGGGATNLFLR